MAANFLTVTDKPLTATGVKNRMIAKLLEQGASNDPIGSHFQGLNRVAQSLLGGYQLRESDKEEKANQALQTQTLAALLTGSAPPQQAAPASMPDTPPSGFAPPAPPMGMPSAPPQNVSGPVPPDDPTMTLSPRQIQMANAEPPQGVAPAVAGITSGPRPPTAMYQPTPTPSPPAPPGPMPGAQPQLPMTSSAAPPDMQAKIAAMLHPSQPPAVQQMGRQLAAQMLAQRMKPNQLKSVVIGDRGFVFDERTGQYTAGPDATKATDDERNLAAENRARAQRGQQPLSMTEFKAAVKAATTHGQAQGEAAASLDSIRSKMPGLESVVTKLDDLSNAATYTWTGRATDAIRRQMEMEPRPSAIARQQYISMVDNQILPLLRDTFGAQFTQKEGESLRSTLGNPDLHPKEKQAVLRAFIEQKRRDVEDLARRTGSAAPSQPSGAAPEATKSIGGKTYVKINGQWFEQ